MLSVVRITTKIPSHTIVAPLSSSLSSRECILDFEHSTARELRLLSFCVPGRQRRTCGLSHRGGTHWCSRPLSPARVGPIRARARARVSWDRHDGETRQLFHVEKKLHRRKEGDKEKKGETSSQQCTVRRRIPFFSQYYWIHNEMLIRL